MQEARHDWHALVFVPQRSLREIVRTMTETQYQHPLMAAYWKQLDTGFPKVEEGFEDVMAEALSVLTAVGRDAYLEAGRGIGKLGGGGEPRVAVLGEWRSRRRGEG